MLAYSNSEIGFRSCSRILPAAAEDSFVSVLWAKPWLKGTLYHEEENISSTLH